MWVRSFHYHLPIWPKEWKKGDWVPVFKKEDKLDEKNYRPITMLIAIDKVFEQLVSKQMTRFIEPNLSINMTAYRKNHSCETTLLKLVEAWKRAIDRKNIVGVLSTDMSKAFDSLHPPLLINKLKAYGFSDCATDLLRSYFSERKNRVRLGTEITSEWKKTTRGCPQGSALGPLLWNIFQNDLPYNVSKCNLTMYADDHQLYFAGKSIGDFRVAFHLCFKAKIFLHAELK